ncbi:hypothetical protein ABFX02_12G160500 [Erythranthe guttata]
MERKENQQCGAGWPSQRERSVSVDSLDVLLYASTVERIIREYMAGHDRGETFLNDGGERHFSVNDGGDRVFDEIEAAKRYSADRGDRERLILHFLIVNLT